MGPILFFESTEISYSRVGVVGVRMEHLAPEFSTNWIVKERRSLFLVWACVRL